MYKIDRCDLSEVVIEEIGVMDFETLKQYAGDHYVGPDVSVYGIVFKTKTELNKALNALKDSKMVIWFLGKNPETGCGEEVIINEIEAE